MLALRWANWGWLPAVPFLCHNAEGSHSKFRVAQFGVFRGPLVSCRCGRPGARTGRQRAVGLDRPGARPLMARPG